MMKELNLKEIFKQAAEAAKQVPENMQEIAFRRALDILLGEETATKPKAKPTRKKSATKKNAVKSRIDYGLEEMLKAIDRTKYPMISKFEKVSDRALLILKIAKDDCEIDGLTPPQIASILTEKFRIRTTRQAVQQALIRATDLVDMHQEGRSNKFRIMSPGEEYLDNLTAEIKE
jgi:hypothetical protein